MEFFYECKVVGVLYKMCCVVCSYNVYRKDWGVINYVVNMLLYNW